MDVDRLFFPSGDESLAITNHNFEIRGVYPFTFFESRDRFAASVKVGLTANTFTTSFSNFEEPGEEGGFRKLDWIINPSIRLSPSY